MHHTRYVTTLIAAPHSQNLAVSDACAQLQSDRVVWLAEGIACDIYHDLTPNPALILDSVCDVVTQEVAHRRKKLLISDMDSTMIEQECIDELAGYVGIKDRVAAITEQAMNGELDFKEALRARVGLLAGLPETALQDVYEHRITPMPGARTLVQTMKAYGAYCLLVSGGFRFFTGRVAAALGFDEEEANILECADGRLTGTVAEPILDKEAKLRALHACCATRGIDIADTLAVGDGANDLPMIQAAGLGVAYHAKPVVQAAARAAITHNDLSALLYLQGYARQEWVQ